LIEPILLACDQIREMCDAWTPAQNPRAFREVSLAGVGDDLMFALDGRKSIANEYRAAGIAL